MNRRSRTLQCVAGLCLVAVLLLSFRAGAEVPGAAFDAANRLYEQGNYKEAAAAYDQLVQQGVRSGPILFNLGNAQAKAGQIGPAIAAYRQGLLLTPRDPDIEANLRFLRNQVTGPNWRPSRGETWLKKLTLNEWTIIAGSCFWLTLICVTARILRPKWKGVLRGWLIAAVMLTAVSVLLLGLALYQARSIITAVVVVPNATVRFGPLEESGSAFTAADGAELRVQDRKDAWVQVASDKGRTGWIRQDQAVLSPGP